jgi:hypothetical protein
MSLKIHSLMPNHLPTTQHKQLNTPKVADKTKQNNQAINRLAVRFGGEDETKPLKISEPRKFETVGGDWRKDEKGKVQFYRIGEDTGKTTRFDEQFYKTADGSFVKLNANGRLKDLPENKDKNRPENVSKFDWKGWEKVSADQVPADYSTVGKTVAFADVEKAKAEINVFKRYAADNKLLDDNLWDEAKVQTAFNNFKSKGGKIEVEANGQTVDGKTQFNVKMDEKSLSLLRTEVANLKAEQRKDVKFAEAGRNEVNQTSLDHGKIVYNSLVNNVEGVINTGIDAALSKGGQNPLILLNPNRPRVDLSGIKADYKSEMMRRDVNGVVDGKGLKRGDVTEGAVTILGPLVVGKVTTPTTPLISVVPKGKLVIEGGRTLTFEESIIANKLAREGKIVEAPIEASNKGIQNVRTPDFIVDGVKTELKTISKLKGKDMSASLSRRILDGAGQGSNIIIDARNQIGMTEEIAKRGIIRAFSKQTKDANVRIKQVRVIGKDFDFSLDYNPLK